MDTFYVLALLACPAGMGLMMWFMMRGHKDHETPAAGTPHEQELAQLRAEVAALRRQFDPDEAHPR